MLQSGGTLAGSQVVWTGTTADLMVPNNKHLWASYAELYRAHVYVAAAVNKLALATARLPLKVYERVPEGRIAARDSLYGQLLRKPHPRLNLVELLLWTKATERLYGEAFWFKVRDELGTVRELYPVHPTKIVVDTVDGRAKYTVHGSSGRVTFDQSEVVHFRSFNPDDPYRGESPLEPLRATLENEHNARTATAAFWKNGARPGVALVHPNKLSAEAAARLKTQWEKVASGASQTGTTVVLEEGMKPETLSLTAEEAQYIQTRKLNREEVAAAYDIPAAAIGILDHATYGNVTELLRSLYRDTLAAQLKSFEATLEHQLRGSIRQGASEPDFGDAYYAEFLMDEVLRGAWEQRVTSYQSGITSGWLTPAEVREMENLPPIEGADHLLIQSGMVPIIDQAMPTGDAPADAGTSNARGLTPDQVRSLMGRLSRPDNLGEVHLGPLVKGLEHEAAQFVVDQYTTALADGSDLAMFRTRLKGLTKEDQ